MRVRTILIGAAIFAASCVVGLKAYDWLSPQQRIAAKAPAITPLPTLPAQRLSSIIVPVSITLPALRDLAERNTPRTLAGRADNPAAQVLQNADITWTAARGAIAVNGANNQLTLAAPLSGAASVKGSLSGEATGAVSDALGKLLGGNVAKQIGVNIKNVNANAELKGTLAMSARPALTPNWRIEPNLAAEVGLSESSLNISGLRISAPAQIKPVIDRALNEQIAVMQQKLRSDPMLEATARREWTKACRSIPLQGVSAQGLWLEMKPVRAFAAQPRIDAAAATLTLGIQAETRVTPAQTRPECPFPAALEIVASDAAGVAINIPVDTPFSEIDRLIEAQIVGKTFPQNSSGPVEVTVKRASVKPSGDRLLISMDLRAKEKSSWFGFGTDATVHIWTRPVLDDASQVLRFTDLQLAVESDAAFGLLGNAARLAVPLVERELAERAAIDLRPIAGNLQRRIGTMIADYNRNEEGVRIAADTANLRLSGLAFDANVLRVIATAEGQIGVTITALPKL